MCPLFPFHPGWHRSNTCCGHYILEQGSIVSGRVRVTAPIGNALSDYASSQGIV